MALQTIKKYVVLLLLTIFWSSDHQAQVLDSLMKVLPSLKDSARVECLHKICVQYLTVKSNNDSAHYYADLCFNESRKINYVPGIAKSLCLKAGVRNHQFKDYKGMEALAREALMWFEKTGNKKEIEIAYWQVGAALFFQYNYDEGRKYFEESYYWAKKNNNVEWEFNVLGFFYENYRDIGEYERAFDAFQKIQGIYIRTKGSIDTFYENYVLAELNRRIGNYTAALNYYHDVVKKLDLDHSDIWYRVSYPELFALNGQFDSASYYYSLVDTLKCSRHELRFYLVSKGEFYLLQKKYQQALWCLLRGLKYHREAKDINYVKRALFGVAKTYDALKDDGNALTYTREGLELSLQSKSKQYIRDAYQILYRIYERKNQSDSAFIYYRQYVEQNKLVENDNVKGKFAAYNYEQKIRELGNEKALQQAMLGKETTFKRLLIAGMIVFVLTGLVLLRNIRLKRKNEINRREIAENELQLQKLESEKAKAALQQRASELEMQALRSQMNPHFIFNSLNSINRFILQNNKASASEYLTKFSRLVRLILQNSQAALISLDSELESLQLYLELEAVRFNHHFEFKVTVEGDLDIAVLKVPPLIIQPYAENAIWHGLMHKEEKGLLVIALYQQEDVLYCKITDDGIGRKKAAEMKSKSANTHKSMGMRITAERIAILQQKKQLDTYVTITDMVLPDGSAAGTEVLLKIPVCYD
jgi:Histidine kinase